MFRAKLIGDKSPARIRRLDSTKSSLYKKARAKKEAEKIKENTSLSFIKENKLAFSPLTSFLASINGAPGREREDKNIVRDITKLQLP